MPPKEAVRALPATPPLLSLLTAAADFDAIIKERDDRWEGGFSYEPEACGDGSTGTEDPCNVGTQTVDLGTGPLDVETFLIWAGDSCSSFGFAGHDYRGRAARKLAACESNMIEDELWRGDRARAAGWDNKFLASVDSDDLTEGVAVSPLDALACLEQGLAECNCGQQGMIHATPQIVTQWIAQRLITRVGRHLETYLGTIVVPGSGYDGSGPGAAPADPPVAAASGAIWAYATGLVNIRLGAVQIFDSLSETLNRTTNTITVRAERVVGVSWDCCHLAVQIDSAICAVGS